jgi:uncharacterized membrane protein YkgB
MMAGDRTTSRVEEQVPEDEHELASGRASWTPAAVLGSVIVVVGVLVAIGLALAFAVYFLA